MGTLQENESRVLSGPKFFGGKQGRKSWSNGPPRGCDSDLEQVVEYSQNKSCVCLIVL